MPELPPLMIRTIEHGGIKVEHYRGASLVKMTITQDEEVEQEVWFDYSTFEDLHEVMAIAYQR